MRTLLSYVLEFASIIGISTAAWIVTPWLGILAFSLGLFYYAQGIK